MHPRHFSLLSNETLEVLAAILNTCEVLGEWLESVSAVTVALIPKAKGGTRRIGLFPALHSLWTRSRRGAADEWESKNAKGFVAASKGQAATDTVWAQALRAEFAVNSKQDAAAILIDLKSFYDTSDTETSLRAPTGSVSAPRS